MKTVFENLEVYKLAEKLSGKVWTISNSWDNFSKDTIGKQLLRSADSIGANIAEGSGRGSYNDNKRFLNIARGSLFETKHWLRQAYKRNLISDLDTNELKTIVDELIPKLSAYINYLKKKH